MLTNARSLSPKILSLHTFFDEHKLDVALITESWLKDSKILNRDVIDLEFGSNRKIIYKNRPARKASARAVGGGVSIVYDKSRCSMRERKIVGNKFELVLAVGKIGKIKRPFAFFCMYLEPKMKAADLDELNELVCSEIVQLQASGDHLIFVGGDLNRKSIQRAIRDFPDIVQLNNEPTRGAHCLDVMFSNSSNATASMWPPLETELRIPSDHQCVLLKCSESQERNFTWVNKKVRKQTDKACRQFIDEIRGMDWNEVLPSSLPPDDLIAKFEDITGQMTDRLFPLVRVRCRSNEPEWITNGIRKLDHHKRRVYKREGKSTLWHTLQRKFDELLEESKEAYIDKQSQAGPKAYYRAIKHLSCNGKQSEWDVRDLFPGKTTKEAANETAAYFTRISDEFEALGPPRTVEVSQRSPLSLPEVERYMKLAKKPNSSVAGDILPRLMKMAHREMSVPARIIFNSVFNSGTWPARWKEETTVIIPKTQNPASLAECRNISCTAFLSKVLESVVLDDLRKELTPDDTQYGGLKQCSVNHLLTEMYESILAPLDEGNPAVIMGIDFEKAFNRLDHQECLKQLRELGASEASLGLVRSFLTGRTMRVKLGDTLSDNRCLSGGSPQGSILGCLLYCIATQQLGRNLMPGGPRRLPPAPTANDDPDRGNQAARQQAAEDEPSDAEPDAEDERGFGLLQLAVPGLREDNPLGVEVENGAWIAGDVPWGNGVTNLWDIVFFKYIDDTTTVEPVDKETAIRHLQASGPTEEVPAELTGAMLERLSQRAAEIGMIINAKKTQLVCVSADNGYKTGCTIRAGNEVIKAADAMKILGFTIGSSPGMHHQVEAVLTTFRKRFWSLFHLRRSGFKGAKLFRLYAVYVRPIIENNSVVYHSMLTRGQAGELERLQALVLRLCFGPGRSYAQLLADHSIQTLEARRVAAVRKFVHKAMRNPRFGPRWFKPRNEIENNLRRRKPYIEKKARTERYFNSPMLHFQRIANELHEYN